MCAMTILHEINNLNQQLLARHMLHYFTRIIAVQKPREKVETRISIILSLNIGQINKQMCTILTNRTGVRVTVV